MWKPMRRTLSKLDDHLPLVSRIYRDLRDRRAQNALNWETSLFGIELLGGNYLASGVHEVPELEAAINLLSSFDVLVDVGANVGLYSCLFAKHGKHAVAIEPYGPNLQILYLNIYRNRLDKEVEVFPVAVADRAGLMKLYGRGQGASLVPGWGDQPQHDFSTVAVNTLDNIGGDRFRPSRLMLKIDVEGAEWDVLQGAASTLGQTRVILIENSKSRNHPGRHNPRFDDINRLLEERAFRLHAQWGENFLWLN
jgi:FkbM family methyltransferase